jgi:hypothetical protein
VAVLTERMTRTPCRHRLCGQGGRVSEARPLQADREHDQERDEAALHIRSVTPRRPAGVCIRSLLPIDDVPKPLPVATVRFVESVESETALELELPSGVASAPMRYHAPGLNGSP